MEEIKMNQQTSFDETKKMGLLKRIIGVFTSPEKVFQYLEKRPGVWFPIIIMALLGAGQYVLIFPYMKDGMMNIMYNTAKAQGIEYTREQLEQMSNIQFISGTIVAPLALIVVWLVMTTIIFWILRLFGGEKGYKKYLSITGYAFLISAAGIIVNAVYTLMSGIYNEIGSVTSLTTFLDEGIKGTFLYGVAAQFDLFNIWYYFVMAIGLCVVSKLSKSKVFTIVFVAFLLFAAYAGWSAVKAGAVLNSM